MSTRQQAKQSAGTSKSPLPQEESSSLALRDFTPEQDANLQTRFEHLTSSIEVHMSHRLADIKADIQAEIKADMAAQFKTMMAEMQNLLKGKDPTDSADIMPSVESPNPHHPSNPPQQQDVDTSYYQVLKPHALRPKDVGFFNPDVPDEHGLGPVATVSSDTVYRDIYTWVERLKDLVYVHGSDDVRQIIQPCLRGSAATWWIAELTDEDRRKLRNAELQRWFSLLIKRFKIQTSVALTRLTSSYYTPQDLSRSPRIWIHQMLHYAKAAEMESTFNQLTIIWNRLDANLRKDIPMPKPTTRLVDFLEQVDAMYPTWVDIKKAGSYGGYRQHGFQPHGFQPQGPPYQDRRRDPLQDPQRNPSSQNPSQSQVGPPNRNVQFERRPRIWRGKEHSKDGYSYMVDTLDDGTPHWVDEDPGDPDNGNGYAEYG